MAKAASPVPAGFHTMIPQLTLDDAAQAIEWYKRALGAEEVSRGLGPDGKIMHAEIVIGNSRFFVNDAMMGLKGPPGLGRLPGIVLAIRLEQRRAVQPRRLGRRDGADADGRPVLGRPRRVRRRSGRLQLVDCHAQRRPDARRDPGARGGILQADGAVRGPLVCVLADLYPAPIFRLKPEATSTERDPPHRTRSVASNEIRGFRLPLRAKRFGGPP